MDELEPDLDRIRARWTLARLAGMDAEVNGWDQGKINALIRSWQDVAVLYRLAAKGRE